MGRARCPTGAGREQTEVVGISTDATIREGRRGVRREVVHELPVP